MKQALFHALLTPERCLHTLYRGMKCNVKGHQRQLSAVLLFMKGVLQGAKVVFFFLDGTVQREIFIQKKKDNSYSFS